MCLNAAVIDTAGAANPGFYKFLHLKGRQVWANLEYPTLQEPQAAYRSQNLFVCQTQSPLFVPEHAAATAAVLQASKQLQHLEQPPNNAPGLVSHITHTRYQPQWPW